MDLRGSGGDKGEDGRRMGNYRNKEHIIHEIQKKF